MFYNNKWIRDNAITEDRACPQDEQPAPIGSSGAALCVSMMSCQGVFLLCNQCSRNGLQIHHNLNQDNTLAEELNQVKKYYYLRHRNKQAFFFFYIQRGMCSPLKSIRTLIYFGLQAGCSVCNVIGFSSRARRGRPYCFHKDSLFHFHSLFTVTILFISLLQLSFSSLTVIPVPAKWY